MHTHSIADWQHRHVFLGAGHDRNERRTWAVVALTLAMMVAEIVGGYWLGSMALVADGWHMATHAFALGIAALAYRFARALSEDERFSFGTGKLGELAAYTSALLLGVAALAIAYESIERLHSPVVIDYLEALPIAVLGLLVNIASAWLLGGDHDHDHDHAHSDAAHSHQHEHHHDANLRAAYVHVLADALTSVLAIAALLAGLLLGWRWLDPLVGLIGAVVIAAWAVGLLRSSGAVLLDTVPDPALSRLIRTRIEVGSDQIADLHLWRIGPGHVAAVISVVSDAPRSPADYKQRLSDIVALSHITVEVISCPHHANGATSPTC